MCLQGIGIVISQSIDNQPAIVVQHVWPGSPAAAAGLRRNDVCERSTCSDVMNLRERRIH